MKQVQYWGSTILERPVKLAVIWRIMLCACELIHIFVCKKNNYAENTRCHSTKFSHLGDQVPGIYSYDIWWMHWALCQVIQAYSEYRQFLPIRGLHILQNITASLNCDLQKYFVCLNNNVEGKQWPDWEEAEHLYSWCIYSRVEKPF
jgi:hypothetical protein